MNQSNKTSGPEFDYAFFGRPCFGERVSGDVAVIEQKDHLTFVAIVDVLGHGVEAHDLAQTIEHYLKTRWSDNLVNTMLSLHEQIRGSRGAAVGLGLLNAESGVFSYTGIGNTCIKKFNNTQPSDRLYSLDGTVGLMMRTPVVQTIMVGGIDVLVLYTDGVQDRFGLNDYASIHTDRAFIISREVVKRFGKKFDDATCIALRQKK